MKSTEHWEDTADLVELRNAQRRDEMAARYRPDAAAIQRRNYCEFERAVTHRLVKRLRAQGYSVDLTTHKTPFDLFVNGARVEVKASHWNERKTSAGVRGRYQGTLRNRDADLVILVAVNGSDHHFIIPRGIIGGRKTVEITSYDVNAYSGRYAPFLEAWGVLAAKCEASTRPYQESLV